MANGTPIARLTVGLWLAGLLLCGLWLTSLDRYLTARYHWSLEAALETVLPAGWLPRVLWASQQVQHLSQWSQGEADRHPPRAAAPAASAGRAAFGLARQAPAWRAPAAPSVVALQEAEGQGWPSVRLQRLQPGPQKILFAGDSMMQGVAPLVSRELSQRHPEWFMRDLSRQSTGLTVRRYFDWPTRIVEEMDAQKLNLLVIFLGPNDPWDLVVDGRRLLFPSPEWAQQYAVRVDEILSAAKSRGVRVIWIGLPAMREGRVKQGAVVQNQIFHDRARAWGTDYLATEPLIGPLSEPFKKFMTDPSGQPVNLRAEDGIHFTPSGLHRIKQAVLTRIEEARAP